MAELDAKAVEELLGNLRGIFGDFFGGSVGKSRDVELELPLTLAEAVEGCERPVRVGRRIACAACRGTGGAAGSPFETCSRCGGTGRERMRQGAVVITKPCASCHGRRGRFREPCATCAGEGGRWTIDDVVVKVPGGVDEGHRLRLVGKGNDLGDGAGPGDAYLTIAVQPDARFTRDGADLHVRARVPRAVATSGGTIEVLHPTGARRARVRAGVRSGDELVLTGWGAVKLGSPTVPIPASDEPYRSADARGHRGDLIVTLEVEGEPLPDSKLTVDERIEREDARSGRRFLVGAAIAALLTGAVIAYVLATS